MITCASRSVLVFNLTCNGPNISSAVFENGGNQAATQILGDWPINWSRVFFRRLRQRTHLVTIVFAIFESPTIQNFRLASNMKLL